MAKTSSRPKAPTRGASSVGKTAAKGEMTPIRELVADRWYLALLIGALALSALVLSPMLHSGFFGDDALQSVTFSRSGLAAEGQTLVGQTLSIVGAGARGGRLFPVSTLTLWPFYLANNHPFGYKIYVLLIVLADLALFGYLVRRLTSSWALGVISILLVSVSIQFRQASFYDPVLGFSAHLPVTVLLMLVSLIALVAYMGSGRKAHLGISLGFYFVCLLTYEIVIPFYLVYLAIIWLYPKKHPFLKSLKLSWPYAAVVGSVVLVTIAARLLVRADIVVESTTNSGGAQSVYAMNLAPWPALRAVAVQVVAALPFSYRLLDETAQRNLLFPGFGFGQPAAVGATLLLLVGYAAVAGLAIWRAWCDRERKEMGIGSAAALVVGAALLVLPNVLIALSTKYQTQVYWGVGYLPVYVSYFGAVLIVIGLLDRVLALAGRTHRALLGYAAIGALLVVVFGYAGVSNYQNNRVDVEWWNRGVWYARELATSAVGRGLLEQVPPGADLVIGGVTSYASWDIPQFYGGVSGRQIGRVMASTDPKGVDLSGTKPTVSATGARVYDLPSDSTTYYLSREAAWSGNGFAFVGRVTRITEEPDGTRTAVLDPTYVYVGARPSPRGQVILAKWPLSALAEYPSPEAVGIDASQTDVVSSGADWVLFRTGSMVVDLGSVVSRDREQ